MPNGSPRGSPRGFTLLELMVATAISGIIAVLATQAIVQVDRDQFLRKNVTDLQSGARLALGWLEQDLRQSSLSVGSGVIWTASGANPVGRPAVQIYANVPGTGFLDVKPNTDALLVVGAIPAQAQATQVTPRTVTAATLTDSRQAIPVTNASLFSAGQAVLMGDYGDASWGVVQTPNASLGQLTLQDQTVNVFPAQQTKQLGAGASVRAARSRLYYVDNQDELVRLTLAVPTAPATALTYTREVLAQGVENMGVFCLFDNGAGAFGACPAPLTGDPGPADPLFTEAQAAFGSFGPQQGPRLTTALTSGSRVSLLRNVIVNVSAHSLRPVEASQADPVIAGVSLPAGAPTPTNSYARRAYQVNAAVRNTSLGAF